jgi:membrane protease YdiL (CAAX protease family)
MGDVLLGFLYSQILGLIPAILAIIVVIATTTDTLINGTASDAENLINTAVAAGPIILASLLLSWAGFLFSVYWAGTRKGDKNWRELIKWRFAWKKDIPIAIVFVLIYRGLEYLLGLTLEHYGVDTSKLSNGGLVSDQTGIWLILVAIAASLGAPVVEEIFFRGMFLTVARRNYGTVAGILITSIIFGLLHAQASLAATLYTVTITGLIGLGLAILVVKTNRLGTSITAHILFNSSAVLLMAIGAS